MLLSRAISKNFDSIKEYFVHNAYLKNYLYDMIVIKNILKTRKKYKKLETKFLSISSVTIKNKKFRARKRKKKLSLSYSSIS